MLLPLNTLVSGDCLPPCFICSCLNWESATNADDVDREEFRDEFEEVDATASASAAAEVIAKVDVWLSVIVDVAVVVVGVETAETVVPPAKAVVIADFSTTANWC